MGDASAAGAKAILHEVLALMKWHSICSVLSKEKQRGELSFTFGQVQETIITLE